MKNYTFNNMKIRMYTKTILLGSLLCAFIVIAQDVEVLDKSFIESLPEDVREDVMKELMNNSETEKDQYARRPSSELQKQKIDESERYGVRIFNSMQSSFMPINEPNFGNNYIVDYGDVIKVQLYGAANSIRNNNYLIEVQRDGTVVLDDIGSLSVAGLNFEQVVDAIKQVYSQSYIGLDVIVTLDRTRDINILITGNVEFPGIYTLSGNSNILQAINIAGGASENGSLRNIVIKRKNQPDIGVDLYHALIFGEIDSIPFLMSGDSVHIEPVKNLVRAGYGFNNTAVFEMLDGETLNDLINYAGGLKIESNAESLKVVRFENDNFKSYEIKSAGLNNYELKNLDSVYAEKENIGVVTISGDVKYPGKYSISSSDRLLDIIQRSGGYTKAAYPFAATLFRKSSQELEMLYIQKAYRNLISYIASNPSALTGSGNEGLGYILSEIKSHTPVGRVIADFDVLNLQDNIQSNIFLSNEDTIHIPSYDSNIYIFGEVGNPGSVLFQDDADISDYINKSGGFTRFSSKDSIFIVSPNGETLRVQNDGLRKYLSQDYDIYPGSVIYVPRHIGKVEGINFYATVAPIFSSLALSIASVNAINN